MTNNNTSVREAIMEMARQHNISLVLTDMDIKAYAIATLSDNDVKNDEARLALVNMRRAGLLSAADGHQWLIKLIQEEKST